MLFVFKDPHKKARKQALLFQAREPKVRLEMTTFMLDSKGNPIYKEQGSRDQIPGLVARKSREGTGTVKENIILNRKLLDFLPVPHLTPFEWMVWGFDISGISKSCITQLDRTRAGIGFLQASGRYIKRTESGFVYNTYHYLCEDKARILWKDESDYNKFCLDFYNKGLADGIKAEDARKRLPVSFATASKMWINTVALRRIFQVRLDTRAEWEINRLMKLIWDKVNEVAPSHFKDLGNV